MNYFELFELPVSIQIDKTKLAQKYFELQKKYHPDFFAKATEHEQAEALEISSQLNKALKIFKNENQTIKYVLQLKQLLEDEEKYQLPPAFLMEMMELNEELNEGSAEEIEQFESELYKEVQPIIENYNDASITTADLLKLKDYYYKKNTCNVFWTDWRDDVILQPVGAVSGS
jgi:molecular chaperone HscB